MFRPAAVPLALGLGLAGCVTTFTPEEIARSQKMNHEAMEMMQQSATAAQNANLTMMMNMSAPMIQPVMIAPP